MAHSFLQFWYGNHQMGNNLYLSMRYAVYYDVNDFNSVPHICLADCELRTAQYKYDSVNLSNYTPATVQIQINGTGRVYTFTVSGSPAYHQGATLDADYNKWFDSYYYIRFSSPMETYTDSRGKEVTVQSHIDIPRNGQEFTINITFTTRNGSETYTIVEHAAGPVSNTLTGPSSIYTGSPSTYSLGQPVTCDRAQTFGLMSLLSVYFIAGESYVWKNFYGYTDKYTSSTLTNGSANTLTFAPIRHARVPIGAESVSSHSGTDNLDLMVVEYYYVSPDLRTTDYIYKDYGFAGDKQLALMHLDKHVKVTARAEIDNALLPEFVSFEYALGNNSVTRHMGMYGYCVQNQTDYSTTIKCMVKYGLDYSSFAVNDYKNGSLYTAGSKNMQGGASYFDYPGTTFFRYNGGKLDSAVTGGVVEYLMTDYFGNVTRYLDRVNVTAYHDPIIGGSVRRCELVSGGSGDGYYNYDGNTYHINENGDYALIEWSISITPLNNINTRQFVISEPKPDGSAGTINRTIQLSSYNDSGYYVVPANPERSYNIIFNLQDDFHVRNNAITRTIPLNTSISAIDFYRGGTGLSFGKVAEYEHVVDIHRDWTLHMPYNTMVLNYDTNGNPARLRDWMTTTDNRIQAIIDHRDIMIYAGRYYGDKIYDNNTITCIPSSYGYVDRMYNGGVDADGRVLHITSVGTAGMLIGDHITINRNYLYLSIMGQSFIQQNWDTPTGTRPMIYIMGTKPTTIDQSTGIPNGTVLRTITIDAQLDHFGSITDGYETYFFYPSQGGHNYIDVSSLKGTTAWIVITSRHGVSPSSSFYQYGGNTYVEVNLAYQTNNRG